MSSETRLGGVDAIATARNNVRILPVPSWVELCAYDLEYKIDKESHVTNLLFDRQIHAELRESFVHVAIRLETMAAVQQQSQWRLQFEPQTQSVNLHFIKVRRGDVVVEQLNLEKGHLFQREEGLSRLVVDGWFTFLQVLEDVRPGDVLEWSYTIQTNPKILSGHYMDFFELPEWTSIGSYQFVVRFKTGRAMKWKTASMISSPLWSTVDGLSIWTWYGKNYAGLKREINTPPWYVSTAWIQISDCPDWQTVAAAISNAWAEQAGDCALDDLIKTVENDNPTVAGRIDRAIQLVQDEYRYLSVNLEFGGQIPTSPEVVTRRRYGDCKDLSFLLVNLFKRLGVQARPILVNVHLRKSVGNILPAPIFNHVVVEFEAEGKIRWIDPTLRRQGGGAFNRVIDDYGLGLPVDTATTELVEIPKIPNQSNLFELRESLLLDTSGATSLLALVSKAEGLEAEKLRNQFDQKGVEEMAKESLQNCANRFGWAKRIGELKFRDDRVANQFFVAEIFEVNRFLQPHPDRRLCQFPIPSRWIKSTLQMPEKNDRRTPFALPYPCQIIHIIDVSSPALRPMTGRIIEPRQAFENSFFQFNRTKKTGHGYWMMTLSLNLLADSVPSDQINKYRELVEQVWRASLWNLFLPLGTARSKPTRDFGELPPAAAKRNLNQIVPLGGNVIKMETPMVKPLAELDQQVKPVPDRLSHPENVQQTTARPIRSAPRKHVPRNRGKRVKGFPWLIIIIVGMVILFFLFLLILVSTGPSTHR